MQKNSKKINKVTTVEKNKKLESELSKSQIKTKEKNTIKKDDKEKKEVKKK